MNKRTDNKKQLHLLVFIGGVLISLLLRLLFPSTYHHFDVHTFEAWAPFVQHLKTVYTTDCYCNYPVIGLLLSSEVINWIGLKGFLLFIAVIDGLNVVLILHLLRKLQLPNPILISGLVGLLPASFVGGALWGQIDTIGQMELLLFLILLFPVIQKEGFRQSYLLILGLGTLLSIALLTKQLLLFPVLIFGFLTLLVWFRQKKDLFLKLVMAFVAFALPILIVDSYLVWDPNYRLSHLQRVFLEGSDHVNFISGNGFNVWMLFVTEMYSSATAPWVLGLSPKIMGLIIVGALALFIFVRFYLHYTRQEKQTLFGGLILAYCLLFLCINLFFTGTHERYLYHFYPFLLLAMLLLQAPRYMYYLAHFASLIYAGFVFGILKQYHQTVDFFMNYSAHRIVFISHIVLFFFLFYFFTVASKKRIS